MKDALEAFEKVLTLLKLPITTWSVILFLVAFLFKDRLKRLWDQALDSLSAATGGEWSYRRFEPKYRKFVRSDHLYMRLVGIRTEEERQPTITDAYVPISLAAKEAGIESSASIDKVARDNNQILILGDPGAGKSTLLAQLIISFTNPKARVSLYRKCKSIPSYVMGTDRQPLPIYIALRRCAGRNRSLRDDLLDVQTKVLSTPVIDNMPRGFLDRALKKGRAILLLDGLDEVADQDSYQDATRKINEFRQSWPLVRIVVTCRKAGWRGGLHPDFCQFVALSLDSRQQYEFIHKWYAAILRYTSSRQHRTEQELLSRGDREADKLLGLIAIKERLREIASNPMILGLICLVHYRKKSLPRGRAALYDECIEILIDLWDRIDKDLDQAFPSTEQKKLLLRRIAHHMHTKGLTEIGRHEVESLVSVFLPGVQDKEAAEIVRELEVRSGLMVERSIDVLNFSHLTFQEFLLVDYFRSEPGAHLSVGGITDWPSWREPLLLMCGVEINPAPLLRQLFESQPTLAILGISEMDPTQINSDVTQLVLEAIDKVNRRTLTLADAVPALVGLLSVEGNPFAGVIEAFIYHLAASRYEEMGNLVEALGKIPTQEAASILLSLLTSSTVPESSGSNLVAGLARIGDPAMYESAEWLRNGKIDDDMFFRIIAACDSIRSTQLLWERYGLDPPKGREAEWAMSWALRLARTESYRAVRDKTVHSGATDTTIWPYPSGTESAVAAITQQSVRILHEQYPSLTPFVSDADRLSSMSLRVQVPLLVKAVGASPTAEDKAQLSRLAEQQKSLGVATTTEYKFRFLPPHNVRELLSSEEYEQLDRLASKAAASLSLRRELPLSQVFKGHSWETLGGFLAQKNNPKREEGVLRPVGIFMAIAIEVVAIALATFGERSMLPPNGSYAAFLASRHGRVRAVAVVASEWLALVAIAGTLISYLRAGLRRLGGTREASVLMKPWEFILVTAIVAVISPVVTIPIVIAPTLVGFFFVWGLGTEVFETSVSLLRIPWAFVTGTLILSAACAFLGLPVLPRPGILEHGQVAFAAIMLTTILGIFVHCRATAFRRNEIAEWLETHPRGREILDEFKEPEPRTQLGRTLTP